MPHSSGWMNNWEGGYRGQEKVEHLQVAFWLKGLDGLEADIIQVKG